MDVSKQIQELKDRIAKLEEINNPPSVWPRLGDKYYVPYITSEDIISEFEYDDDWFFDHASSRGLAKETSEEAFKLSKRLILIAQMDARAKQLNGSWRPDFEDITSIKYGLYVENIENDLKVIENELNVFIFGIAVETESYANILLKEFGSRITEIYNQG